MNKQTRTFVFIFTFIVFGIMCLGLMYGWSSVYADKLTYCGEGLDIGDRMATDDHIWVTEYGHYICDICGVDGGFAPANDITPDEPEKPVHKHHFVLGMTNNDGNYYGGLPSRIYANYCDECGYILEVFGCDPTSTPDWCEHNWFMSEVRNDGFIHTIRYICTKCGEIKVVKEEHNMALMIKDRYGCTIIEYWRCNDCGYSTSCEYESHIGPFHRYTGDIIRCEYCDTLFNYTTGESYDEPA